MRRALAALCAVVILGIGSPAVAAVEPEYVLKAKILFHVLSYPEWSSQGSWGDQPFQLAVLGKSPFGTALEAAILGQTVQHRAVQIKYISKIAEAEGCQAVFICASESARIDAILAWAEKRPILTVSDEERLSKRGVMVNLLMEGRFVRLVLNPDAAQASGIKLGAHLLKTGRIVSTRRSS